MDIKRLPEDKLIKCIHQLLRHWRNIENYSPGTLCDLISLQSDSHNVKKVILEGLDSLAKQDQQSAQILKLRFLHGNTILSVAREFNLSPDQLNRRQRHAIRQLAEILLNRERAMREERTSYYKTHLQTPSYSTLFGMDDAREKLTERLSTNSFPWVISIVGIGGIGKTALADAVSRQIFTRFNYKDIAWLRVQNQQEHENGVATTYRQDFQQTLAEILLPANTPAIEKPIMLKRLLKSQPYLLVVDNLYDEATYQSALEEIYPLLNPSKLIMTSRYYTTNQSETLVYPMKELSLEDTTNLLSHHAHHVGLGDQVELISRNAPLIYQVVGGNPLAIKLLVDLLASLPLTLVLKDFSQTKIRNIQRLYRHIFVKAWQTLDDNAKALLLSLAHIPDTGALLDDIRVSTGFSQEIVTKAIQDLFSQSLIEPLGTIERRLYGIHRLTVSFLQTDMVSQN